jgi:crossover junction endodeoxyribonuclease RuvC
MRIIGIDPGLRCLGWGVVDVDGSRLRHVANGSAGPMAMTCRNGSCRCISQLTAIVGRHAGRGGHRDDLREPGRGGHAEAGAGAGRRDAGPAAAGIPVAEYAPNAVKKAVVGAGHADKRQIDHMVRMQLAGCRSGRAGRGRRAGHRAVPCLSRAQLGASGAALPAGGGVDDRQALGSARLRRVRITCCSMWAAWATSSSARTGR